MYKTVRHGENSLQYTILPQTEEVLSNSGLKGKGRDYSPSIHVRRSRRKSALKYILLIIIGIIVALAFASVPLYVLNGALYARRLHHDQHEVMTAAPLTPAGREIVKSRKKELKIAAETLTTLKPKLETSGTPTTFSSTSTKRIPTTVASAKATTPPWNMPALRSWKFSSSTTMKPVPTEDSNEIPFVGTPSGSVRLLDHYMSMKPWEKDIIIRPTVTPDPITVRNVFKYYSRTLNPVDKIITTNSKIYDDVLITTKATTTKTPLTTTQTTELNETSEKSRMKYLKDAILSVDDDDDFKESLEVDEVFSLPPLKPETSAPATDMDEVTVSKATDSGWYGARWPFVDTSSYFQWTGYSPGDNLLLPLLVAALSSIALVLLLALAVRRRKRTTTASAQIGVHNQKPLFQKLTADLHTDDNTNLLTAENPEETEE